MSKEEIVSPVDLRAKPDRFLSTEATLRDQFAMAALPEFIRNWAGVDLENEARVAASVGAKDGAGWITTMSYSIADAMLEARKPK